MRTHNVLTRLIISALVAFCCGIVLFWCTYEVASVLAPPVTSDGHPVMPLGQLFLGLCTAVPRGIFIWWKTFRRWSSPKV